jgi:agmatinase
MGTVHPNQFLGLAPVPLERADVVILPVPFERTVSYGTGTGRAPQAILDASRQIESFDDEAGVDFAADLRLHTAPPFVAEGSVEDYLEALRRRAAELRGRPVLAIGGEHTVTYGLVTGLAEDPAKVTVVQVDAHADLMDRLHGLRWSHGTVARRLWEAGCAIVQVGVRSLSREEHEFCRSHEHIVAYHAHELPARWPELIETLRRLEGDVYLTVDVDGLDPSVMPSTGTPQPDGLSWRQTMEFFATVCSAPGARLVGADVVEFVPSPHPPGCDIIAAKLVAKLVAFWHRSRA